MSNRVLKVGLVFSFYVDNEHEDLFEEMTEEQMVHYAKQLVCEDIDRYVKYNEVYDGLSAEFVEEASE